MTNPILQDLQKDVIDLLEQVKVLMNRASTVPNADGVTKKYTDFEPRVSDEINKVKNLELRMAVVAPMKAGKSTIVNAIVGQEILPSRNSAMTTLPTEVIFDAEVTQPVLILSEKLVKVFQDTWLALKEKINELGIEQVQQKIKQYPHLAEIPHKIQDSLGGLKIPCNVKGRDNIIEKLAELNDVIRLCNSLAPHTDPLSHLDDIPRIQTPLPRFQKNAKTEQLGSLVIVDTPGQNEAGENLKLKGVVEEQLKKSSIVLIVLDFTQLKTESAEKVKEDVSKVIEIRGKENLYALVNKVDQRREGDMTPEQVQQFVAAEFGIGDTKDTNRVFEISAIKAFTSANFIQELELNPGIEIAAMRTAKALAKEALGNRWEAKFQEFTVEQLREEADELRKASNFEKFLNQAIDALMAEAAPRSITSTLNITKGLLRQLINDVEVIKKVSSQEGNKLKQEIQAFEKDLKDFETFNQHLHDLDKIKADLFNRLNEQIEDIKKEAKSSIQKKITGFENSNSLLKNIVVKMRSFTSLNMKNSDVIEFENENLAKYFMEEVLFFNKKYIDPLLDRELKKVEKIIEDKRKDLINSLKQNTTPIIQRARQRLKALDLPDLTIELLLPMPDLDTGDIVIETDVERQVRTRDGGYRPEVVRRRTWRHWLWIVPKEEITCVKQPDVTEDYYTVSRQEIVKKSNEYIEGNIQNIKQGIEKYIDEDFKQEVERFFQEVERQLSNIREQLKSAQQAQKLEAEEREQLLAEFDLLFSEASQKSSKADTYLNFAKQMMS